MKNQYFGDVNDYRKYGLLRILSDDLKIKLFVCWMLTASDDKKDGTLIEYLSKTHIWRKYDPGLFDALHESVITAGNRNVSVAEEKRILLGASFQTILLADSLQERNLYFNELSMLCRGYELIFFDPDNGFEVKSVKKGKKNSSKYLYWDELQEIYSMGHSVMVYQHYPRVRHDVFISRISEEIIKITTTPEVLVFETSNVAFFLAPQTNYLDIFLSRAREIGEKWKGQIKVSSW